MKTGKCDTCRERKVKCDETKPVCNACRKKNRPCNYNFPRSRTFIQENLTRKPERERNGEPSLTSVAPSEDANNVAQALPEDGLRLTMKKQAGGNHGVFQTFALMRKSTPNKRRRIRVKSEKNDEEQKNLLLAIPAPSLSPAPLAARCTYMFGPLTWTPDSRAIYGAWMDAVPGRIGFSRVLDLALEYALDSFAQYKDRSYSSQKASLVSRGKALKALREGVKNFHGRPSYDLVLATKLHAMAEIFIESGTLWYATHCVGLSEQLSLGTATGLDEYSHWGLVDHTYMDEVTDAILTGRPSVFDSPKYLEHSHASASLGRERRDIEYQNEARAIMLCMVQIPRLSCWIRRSVEERHDTATRIQALALARSIWESIPSAGIDEVLESATMKMASPPSPDIKDIFSDSLSFVSVHALIICTRFWSLQIHASSLIQTLWREFPDACAAAGLAPLQSLYEADMSAARGIIQSLPFTLFSSQYLPVVPLRMLSPLSLSVGSWYRLAQRLTAQKASLNPASSEYPGLCKELEDAVRMEDCIVEQCNSIHESWRVGRVAKSRFEMLIPVMAGGEMPDWMPNKVNWTQAKMRMVKQADQPKKFNVRDDISNIIRKQCDAVSASSTTSSYRVEGPPRPSASASPRTRTFERARGRQFTDGQSPLALRPAASLDRQFRVDGRAMYGIRAQFKMDARSCGGLMMSRQHGREFIEMR